MNVFFDRRSSRAVSVAALAAATAFACGGPDGPGPNGEPANVPGTDLWIDAGDGLDHGLMTELSIVASEPTVEIERTFEATISIEGIFEDGATVAIPEQVAWTSSDEATVAITALGADGVTLRGLQMGTADVTAEIGTLSIIAPISVIRPGVSSLAIEEVTPVAIGAVGELRANATLRDGTVVDVTKEASWSSSAATEIATFDDVPRRGRTWALTRGEATITATMEGQSASFEVSIPCGLDPSPSISRGNNMPNLSWPAAVRYDMQGNRTVRQLSVEDLMCDEEFAQYRAFSFSLNAGWCGPCHAWMRALNTGAQQLDEAGILPVFVIGDGLGRGQYDIATTEWAENEVSRHIGNGPGIRVGDVDTIGGPASTNPALNGVKHILQTTSAWPSVFIVRKSDMQVIHLDGGGLAGGVNGVIQTVNLNDNSGGGGGAVNNCEDGVDEALEPNDVVAIAAPADAGTIEGGICNGAPDFYRVDIEGPWTATVQFSNSATDIDMFEWNPQTDGVMIRDNMAVQSISVSRDFETLELNGPAVINIKAKRGSGPYSLIIERR